MATLISELVSGFSDAANGTAEIYVHGTATLSSQVYSDANGTTSAGTTHPLSASGRVVRYVTELVDVVVKNSSGSTVVSFSPRVDARTVRVENTLFTGPNASGSTVAGGRTVLHDDLTLFRASLGTDDAYVNPNGTDFLIKDAIGSSTGIYYNVKSGYGAKGDGSTDDTASIQAAINAAIAASGGIVFFPPGTYNITSALSVTGTAVTLQGSGFGTTTIQMGVTGVANWLTLGVSGGVLRGLTISPSTTTFTGTNLRITGDHVYVDSCRFLSGAGACLTENAFYAPTVVGCYFELQNASGRWVSHNSEVSLISCTMRCGTITATGGLIDGSGVVKVLNCYLETSNGGSQVFFTGASGDAVVANSNLQAINASGTATFFQCGVATVTGCYLGASGTAVLADNNVSNLREAGSFVNGPLIYPTSGSVVGVISLTRNARHTTTSVAGTSYTVLQEYGIQVVTHTSGAGMAFNNPTGTATLPEGLPLTIIYENSTGAGVTPTWGTKFTQTAATAVANNNTAVYEFRYHSGTGAGEFICITGDPQEAGA